MNSRIWLDNGQTENLNWIIVGEPEDMSQKFLDEIDTWNNGRFYYQDCQTQQIHWHKKYCFNFYGDCIMCQKMWKEGSKIF